jgi:hypothetical protein
VKCKREVCDLYTATSRNKPNHNNMKTNHWDKSKKSITKVTHNFSLEVHVLAGTLHPCCVDHHFMVRRLIGNPKASSPRAPQEPTASEVTRWHEQFTRVAFGAAPGKAQHPSQITGRWPRTSTTLVTTPPLSPSRLGGGNHQELQESRSQCSPKCQLDANSQANALEITQTHFDLSIKQERWVRESMLSLRWC